MKTTALAPETEAPCRHLNRTDAGKPDSGRQVCDNLECKQIFQDGVPVPRKTAPPDFGRQSSEVPTPKTQIGQPADCVHEKVTAKGIAGGRTYTCETCGITLKKKPAAAQEAEKATKAAAKAADKEARRKKKEAEATVKHIAGRKISQAEKNTERQKYIDSVSQDATDVIGDFAAYIPLYKTAQEAEEARDTFKKKLLTNPKFAAKVQRIRDFFATKKYNEFLTVNGHDYKSIKPLFIEELKITYDYVRKLGSQLGRLDNLLTPAEELKARKDAAKAKREAKAAEKAAAEAAQQSTETETSSDTQQSANEVQPEVNLSFSIAERVQTAFGFAVSCTRHLSPAEKDEFYSTLISRLHDELQPEIVQTTGFGYSRTAADLERGTQSTAER
jgi:hypothetical protein